MPDWRKPLKNKKRFDARYFLSERRENQEVVENSVQQEQLKKDFHDFSFDSWLVQEEIAEEEEEEGTVIGDEGEEGTVIGDEGEDPNYDEPLAELVVPGVGPKSNSPQDDRVWADIEAARDAKKKRAEKRAALKKEG
jgi:hypothetical protein